MSFKSIVYSLFFSRVILRELAAAARALFNIEDGMEGLFLRGRLTFKKRLYYRVRKLRIVDVDTAETPAESDKQLEEIFRTASDYAR
jgi:hypothetical protein